MVRRLIFISLLSCCSTPAFGGSNPVLSDPTGISYEFDYENKYNGKTQELCPPQHVDAAVLDNAKQLAEKIHNLLGCQDYSRTDMIVKANGELVVLETNTLPGMTDQSLFPKAAAASGYPMPELVKVMVETALARH